MSIDIWACSFEQKFQWVKQTFEDNDAGFQIILERKGQSAYDTHNQMITQRIKSAQDLNECVTILRDWLRFFDNKHTGIGLLTAHSCDYCTHDHENDTHDPAKPEFWNGDIAQFQDYLTNKTELDYEGIWDISGNYKVGIVKEGNTYIGFIIESKYTEWQPNMVKLKIENIEGEVKSTYYLRNFSPELSSEPKLYDNYLLRIKNTDFIRLYPEVIPDPAVERHLKFLTSKISYIEELNDNTMYLRIPEFCNENFKVINELIKNNFDKISETDNLIIDLRNNRGGRVDALFPFVPLFYTNPFSQLEGAQLRITKQSLNYYKSLGFTNRLVVYAYNFRNIFRSPKKRKEIKNNGLYVNVNYQSINKDKEVSEYPINIAVIINDQSASAAETFALHAKQSRKVKLFGTTTFGSLDYGNPIPIKSPCGQIRLIYTALSAPTAKEFPFDYIGIQPDFLIDSSIPDYKWVDYINEIMQYWVAKPELN